MNIIVHYNHDVVNTPEKKLPLGVTDRRYMREIREIPAIKYNCRYGHEWYPRNTDEGPLICHKYISLIGINYINYV